MTKLLFVTDHFLPGFKAGGPIKSIANLYQMLCKDFEITILTVNHDFQSLQSYDFVTDTLTSYEDFNVIYLSNTSLFHIDKIIETLAPDVIYLNSFFSHFSRKILFVRCFRNNKRNIILAPRGELSQEALSLKRFKKMIYLWIFKVMHMETNIVFHTTDGIEKNAVLKLFPNSNIVNIPNLISSTLPNVEIIPKESKYLKVLFLSRISRKKNLLFALKVMQKISSGSIQFDIYGPIEDKAYWEECMDVVRKMPSTVIVQYKGAVHPTETSTIFRQYHLFFLPTLNENFGHAIVEAMQNGVLPLISTNTPWNGMHTIGWTLPLNDDNAFVSAIDQVLQMNNTEFHKRSSQIQHWINHTMKINTTLNKYIKMFQG